jgi:type IV pilus assembly protein PilE
MLTGASHRRAAGFTLTELMVAIAIATILTSIALPSYLGQIRKSRRTEARTTLLNMATTMERMYSTTNSYLDTNGKLIPLDVGYSNDPAVNFPLKVGGGYYTVNAAVTATTFTFTATPTAGNAQAADKQCATFSITETGLQSAADSGGGDTSDTCWN